VKLRTIFVLSITILFVNVLFADPLEDAYRKRDWVNVKKLATESIAKDAGEGDYYRYLGIAQAATGDTTAAIDNLKHAIALAKKDGKAVLALTSIYIANGNIIDARQLANVGNKNAKSDLNMQAARALALAYTDSIDAASTLIWNVVSKDSTNATFYKIQGLISRKEGVLEFVINAFNNALRFDSGDNDIRYELGLALLSDKRGGEALAAFQKVYDTEPTYPGVNYQLGKILYYNARSDTAKLKEALPHLEASIKEKVNAEALKMIGESYLKLNRLPDAEKILKEALGKKDDPTVRKLLADILLAGKKFDEATDLWKPLIATPDYDAMRFQRLVDVTARFWGRDSLKWPVLNTQADLMKQAYKADTTQQNLLGKIGLVYYTIDKFDSSAVWYRKKLAVEPKNDTAWVNLGYAYAAMDKYDEALDALHHAVTINDATIAPFSVMVDVLQKQKRDKEAMALLDSLSSRKDFDEKWFMRLAGMYYTSKQYTKSLKVLEKADAAFPNTAEIWVWIGINWYQRYAAEPGVTEHLNRAKAAFRKALQYDPNNEEAKNYLNQLNK